ncbi:hypothetical protein V2A60_002656 [Cordyceps javanica]|uniref:Integral inner nuclear membrane protein Ima1 n=1 Tax=Cordyceps javanica TaxID=43265 RepID=A0A545UXX6_9HYPO|nr:integral inner nuclear membrane protein Ima1 [Cordyceps javanica]TQW06185.1 integral inner nuclear membrane protein Ima1 [Cordyceps javanica]
MRRIGRTKHLSCFYCGKQTGLKYDGIVTNFLCVSCDATNYLDQNGDITDPPVATEREAAPSQYAKPQPAAAGEPDVVFCAKCLKNQRLFTASLAQYLPDDPSHPDYDELDRNYYRYRRNLEKRYPQVCDECADKVQDRIRQAGYTAKTDHLRRMMDKSRGRKATQRTGILELASSLGGWLWRGGLAAQLLWHLLHILQALERLDDGMYDPDNANMYAALLAAAKTASVWLPDGDVLIRMSIAAAILSSWWNPHFIYFLESRSIKVDTTPLFRPEDKPLTPRRNKSPAKRREEDSKTFSELFNEALDSTPRKGGLSTTATTPGTPNFASGSAFVPPSQFKSSQQRGFNDSPLESAPTFKPLSQPAHVDEGDEMDWSPSQPQHRAFRDSQEHGNATRPFGQSPTHADRGQNPFWFKVPPAPTNPARQLRNPPNMPVLRQKPVERDDIFFTSRRDTSEYKNRAGSQAGSSAGTDFRNPSFFAPEQNDEANNLADLLGGSFNLGHAQQQGQPHDRNGGASPASSSPFSVRRQQAPTKHRQTPPRRRHIELTVLGLLLPSWLLLSASSSIPYSMELRGLVLVAAGVVALSSTHDMGGDAQGTLPAPKLFEAVLSALGIVELAAVCWVGWETWTGRVDVSAYGAGVLTVMLGHHATRLLQA